MKDNGVATVFGEDTTTRGGGATVMAHKGTFAAFNANMFTPLPFAGDRSINSKLVSQDMSITFCQVCRQNGKLIEDFGVEVDYLVRPSVGDVLPGGQSLRQLSMIAGVLGKKAPASK